MKTLTTLSLGSNLGNRESHIASMERELSSIMTGVKFSPLMETAPVGVDDSHPPYLNKIIAGYYTGVPRQLLDICHAIESRLGRTREKHKPKSPRTADIDILLFGNLEVSDDTPPHPLIIPHPQILNRRFCLEGLMSINPQIIIPGFNRTVGELYKNMCADVAVQNVSFL